MHDDTLMDLGAVPETRYVRTEDGVHVGYQVFGEGPYDFVLNDGWLSNVDANWDVSEFAPFLRALARRARVIMFDRRGFGVSDRPSSPEDMTLDKGLDDLRAVLDAAGSERAVMYGFEAGAALSLLFAGSYPERTQGLILVAPLVCYWRSADFPWGSTEVEAREWDEWIERSWGTVELWRWNIEEMGATPNEDELREWARWSRLAASPQAALNIDRVERQIDVRALLPQIRVPTLVVLSERDRDRTWGAAPWVAEQIPGARYVEIPNALHWMRAEDVLFFEEIDRFVSGIRDEEAEFDRVLATVLFTDIVGSTERAVELGDRAWRDLVERHHAAVRGMLGRYRGTEVDTAGDGFFATFDGPARGVRCAQQIVEAVRPLGLEVRAGVHTGEVQTIDGKVGGLGVVIGSRLGSLAGPSEVLVSQTVKDLVAGSGLAFEDRGRHALKGVPDEWQLYAVARSEPTA
jgi:pimeloyl-ACP methyl ester carboxylesterase/class 3 adenylate cyclase